ncbi:flagellar hook-basal body complex protein [Clostridium omnivorum]|uniref:flagellar hook-basal body complex protein n=1 Tax=Clostridium omnivorum TaxID=1604902 RepID=UPI003F490D5E
MEFSAGTALNGYTIELRTVAAGTSPSAQVDTANKKILVDGDFVTPNAMTALSFKNAINQGLSNATPAISQVVSSVSGAYSNISGLAATTDSTGKIPHVPGPASMNLGGFDLTFGNGGQLNGYTIKLGTVAASTTTSASIDTTGKTLTVNVDLTTTPPDTTALATQIKAKVNAALASNNITQPQLTTVAATTPGTVVPGNSSITVDTTGSDLAAPTSVTVGGMNFAFNNGTTFNGYTIELGKISVGTALNATVDTTNKKITIDGDFITPNAFTTSALQTEIDNKVGAATFAAGTAFKSDGTAGAPKITVTGAPKNITGISSRSIDGGTNLAQPAAVSAGGFNFQPAYGAALNDYKFIIGTVAAGTEASASVDTAKKIITINGDFTVANGVTNGQIQNAINTALEGKGIMQAISVTGINTVISDFKSNNTNGGTPVQSMKADGTVSFVDGTKIVNAYDESLKSLKIPDKIHDDAANIDLRVRTFSVGKDGVVSAVLEDGRVTAIGQLAMATFKNPAGLTKLGKNLYHGSVNSGDATLRSGAGTLGEDNSKGYGDVLQGMLEMSNVDLAEQFTDMIVTSRAFQASSKVITTGDEILQDILNLKR